MTYDTVTLWIDTTLGMGIDVSLQANLRDPAMLRRLIARAELKSTPPPPPTDDEDSPNDDDPMRIALRPQQYLPVTLWHTSTHDAMDGVGADALHVIAQQLAAAKLLGTGTLALNARAYLTLHLQGRTAWGESTDSELTVTARTSLIARIRPSRTARSPWVRRCRTSASPISMAVITRSRSFVGRCC
jgi:hypothetical protein